MSKKKKKNKEKMSKGVTFDTFTEENIDSYIESIYVTKKKDEYDDEEDELFDLHKFLFSDDESDESREPISELEEYYEKPEDDMVVPVKFDNVITGGKVGIAGNTGIAITSNPVDISCNIIGTDINLTYNETKMTGVFVDDGFIRLWVPITEIKSEMKLSKNVKDKLYLILKYFITGFMKPVAIFTESEMFETFKYLKFYNDIRFSFVRIPMAKDGYDTCFMYAIYDNSHISVKLKKIFYAIESKYSDFTLLSTMSALFNVINSAGFAFQLNNSPDRNISDIMAPSFNHKEEICDMIFNDKDTKMSNEPYNNFDEMEESIVIYEYPHYIKDQESFETLMESIAHPNEESYDDEYDEEYDDEYDYDYYDDEYDSEEIIENTNSNETNESTGVSNDNQPFQETGEFAEDSTEESDDSGEITRESVDDSSESDSSKQTTFVTTRTVRSRNVSSSGSNEREEEKEEEKELQEFGHDGSSEEWEEETEELQEFRHDEPSGNESEEAIEEESILDIENPDDVALDIDDEIYDDESDDMTIPVQKG